MPRLQLRLGTFALLIVIIALAAALLVQRRRDTTLHARLQAVEEEKEWARASFHRLQAVQQKQINELRSQVARTTGGSQEASRKQPFDPGR
jgi:hypothetical protein